MGVVDLQTIVTNEQYKSLIPEEQREESECKYIFVVRNPRKLIYPIKMRGNKDLYQIDKELL